MLRIKKLYIYIYQSFLPFLVMTTSVVLFIFVVQQIWQHIEKLVGKGLETMVILEFLLYSILFLIPQVIPLAILLASLMVFGSLGERLELLAIKASGVSLIKVMNPLIILVSCITIGSFFYQDKLVPKFNVKLQSLVQSIKDKNPEVAIPEGSFYNEVPGYSIYVKNKNKETHMLYGVMLYDLSGGFENISVDFCDSAKIETAPTKDYQQLTLYDGESFSNVKSNQYRGRKTDYIPHMRERYKKKIYNIPFSSEMERVDETRYDETYIAKTLSQLQYSVDSLNVKLDSVNLLDRTSVKAIPIFKMGESKGLTSSELEEARVVDDEGIVDRQTKPAKVEEEKNIVDEKDLSLPTYDFDSLFAEYAMLDQRNIIASALSEAKGSRINTMMYSHIESPKHILQRNIRMHEIYWYKVFTLSLSCLVFFFIGASLGAIIGKGGMGVPVIICVFLYIFYYIVNNVGYKLARDGNWEVWEGVWLSTAILIPIAVFFTYKSMRESALFNTEAYNMFLRKMFRLKSEAVRRETREPLYVEIPMTEELGIGVEIVNTFRKHDNKNLKDIVNNSAIYYEKEDRRQYQLLALSILKERGAYLFDVRVNNYDYNYSLQLVNWLRRVSVRETLPLSLGVIFCLILNAIFRYSVFEFIGFAFLGLYIFSLQKIILYMGDFARSLNIKDKNIFVIIATLFFSNIKGAGGLIFGFVSLVLYPLSMKFILKKFSQMVADIKGKSF